MTPCDCPRSKLHRVFSGRPYFVHVGWQTREYNQFMTRYAEEKGLDYQYVGVNEDLFKTANVIKNAAIVLIWNGLQHYAPLIARMCQLRAIPHAFYEWGLLPQSESFIVDPHGLTGNSILMHDLSWVEFRDIEKLQKMRKWLQNQCPLKPVRGRVLVVCQVENDSQVLHHTAYNSMNEFIRDMEDMFPDKELVVRPHPKSKAVLTAKNVSRDGDILTACASADLVVGLTSTALYEAGVLGVPVRSFGCHPLAGNSDHDKVLAGILALRADRKTGRLADILERFKVVPNA